MFTQLARTDPPSAAMKAVELGLAWITRGDLNIGQGWMNRARRLLDGAPEGPTHGYLAYLDAAVAVIARILRRSPVRVTALRDICGRVDVPAVTALCRVAEALAAIVDARMTEAFGLLDEAMLPVLAGQVPIEWAGDIYCTVAASLPSTSPTCPACGPGRSRWSAGATTSPRRPPTAASATCTGSNCWPPPTTTAGSQDRLAAVSQVVGGRQHLGGR